MSHECMRHRRTLSPLDHAKHAPVAQLDRALDYESRGQEFESLRARQQVFDYNLESLSDFFALDIGAVGGCTGATPAGVSSALSDIPARRSGMLRP